MGNEITIQSQMTIKKGEYEFLTPQASFQEDMTNARGGNPGFLQVAAFPSYVNPSLGSHTTPARIFIRNLDDTDILEFGYFDGTDFNPIGEVLPETHVIFRLSRNLSAGELAFSARGGQIDIEVYIFDA